MSGYLTHLVRSALRPEPEIRPRLASPFEPTRPEPDWEPHPVEGMATDTGLDEEQGTVLDLGVRLDTALQVAGVSGQYARPAAARPPTPADLAAPAKVYHGSNGSTPLHDAIAGRRPAAVAEGPRAFSDTGTPSGAHSGARAASEAADATSDGKRPAAPHGIDQAPLPAPPPSRASASAASSRPMRPRANGAVADAVVIVPPLLAVQPAPLEPPSPPGRPLPQSLSGKSSAVQHIGLSSRPQAQNVAPEGTFRTGSQDRNTIEPAVVAPTSPEPTRLEPTPGGMRSSPMLTSAPAASGTPDTTGTAPTIQVTIGRIEVRAAPAPEKPARTISKPKVMGLEEYLKNRDGDRR